RIVEQHERPLHHAKPRMRLDQVLSVTVEQHALRKKELTGRQPTGRINRAREITMYHASEITDYSLPQIGDAFGGRSHTTVLHGYNKVAEMMEEDENFRYELMALREQILRGDD